MTFDPPGGTYYVGTGVTLTATSDTGWWFSDWSGDLSGSANPATVTMNSDKTVTVKFVSEDDKDDDGMPDAWEKENGLDPSRDDSGEDPDGDGLTNLAEYQNGTNPKIADTDGDGYDDREEVWAGSNSTNDSSYPEATTINLKEGFNLVAIPADVANQPDLKNWLPVLGDSTDIEKVLVYDTQAGKFITLIPGDASNPSFMLQGGEGLIVYAKQDVDITFTSVLRSTLDLKPGFNLVGFACPGDSYTAFQLLTDLESENVSSIQRYSTEKGAFETAGFLQNGPLVGVDFPIVPCEGYFIYMK